MIILAYGMPGAGKSTLLHDLVRAMALQQRFFIADHEAGWLPHSVHWRGRPPSGLRAFHGTDALERLVEEELPPVGVYVLSGVDGSAVARLAATKGASAFVDDEIDLIARRQGWEESPLRAIVHQGRHLENAQGEFTQVHILGACRRPQNLHTDLSELADQVFAFRLRGGNTKRRLLDDNVLENDAEWEALRHLPNFHFKHMPSESWLSIPPLGGKPVDAPGAPQTDLSKKLDPSG